MSKRKYKDETWLTEQYVEKERTQVDIAEECDVAYQTIGRWLEKFDIDRRNHYLDDDVIDEICELYNNTSLTHDEIGDEVGVSAGTVNRVKERNGLERHYDGSVCVTKDPRGYREISYKYGSERAAEVYVHRLIAVAHHGLDFFSDKVVHHKNGRKFDNRHDNLEVLTQAEHQRIERNALK